MFVHGIELLGANHVSYLFLSGYNFQEACCPNYLHLVGIVNFMSIPYFSVQRWRDKTLMVVGLLLIYVFYEITQEEIDGNLIG